MDIFADLNTTVLRRYPFFIYHNITNMIPEPEYVPAPNYIKIDAKYAKMLYTLSEHDRDQIFKRILWEYIPYEDIDDIEDPSLLAIYELLYLDLE